MMSSVETAHQHVGAWGLALVALGWGCSSSAADPAPPLAPATVAETDVFVGGQEGYPTYRIPSVIETASGALLAFAEGRQNLADTGDIDLVMKRSLDGGATWSKLSVVIDQGGDVAGNPSPVVDRATGAILLLFDTNPAGDPNARRVLVTRSADEGATWSTPIDLTADVKPSTWTFYAVGPGRGIQLRDGRFVVACDHHDAATGESRSHVIYSDDGVAWHLGGSLAPDTDESQVAELDDGSLVINARDLSSAHLRAVARSVDRGLTWSDTTRDPALRDPSCEGSLLATPHGLVFSNPDSTVYLERKLLTVRVSRDGGRSWAASRVLHAGPAAYSALAQVGADDLGCLYEHGEKLAFAPYERITFARFAARWIGE